jgi:nucleotide-binding universal stress UspA family protein
MSRRVLHPSDFSRASGAAFKKAVEMAKAGRGQLMVVHVLSSKASRTTRSRASRAPAART